MESTSTLWWQEPNNTCPFRNKFATEYNRIFKIKLDHSIKAWKAAKEKRAKTDKIRADFRELKSFTGRSGFEVYDKLVRLSNYVECLDVIPDVPFKEYAIELTPIETEIATIVFANYSHNADGSCELCKDDVIDFKIWDNKWLMIVDKYIPRANRDKYRPMAKFNSSPYLKRESWFSIKEVAHATTEENEGIEWLRTIGRFANQVRGFPLHIWHLWVSLKYIKSGCVRNPFLMQCNKVIQMLTSLSPNYDFPYKLRYDRQSNKDISWFSEPAKEYPVMLCTLYQSYIQFALYLYLGVFPTLEMVKLKDDFEKEMFDSPLGYFGQRLEEKDGIETITDMIVGYDNEGVVLNVAENFESATANTKKLGYVRRDDYINALKWYNAKPYRKEILRQFSTRDVKLVPIYSLCARNIFAGPNYIWTVTSLKFKKGQFAVANPDAQNVFITSRDAQTQVGITYTMPHNPDFEFELRRSLEECQLELDKLDAGHAFVKSLTTNASGTRADDPMTEDYISNLNSMFGFNEESERLVRKAAKTRIGHYTIHAPSFFDYDKFIEMLKQPIRPGSRQQLQRRDRAIAQAPTAYQVAHAIIQAIFKTISYKDSTYATGKQTGTILDVARLMFCSGSPLRYIISSDISGFDGASTLEYLYAICGIMVEYLRRNDHILMWARPGYKEIIDKDEYRVKIWESAYGILFSEALRFDVPMESVGEAIPTPLSQNILLSGLVSTSALGSISTGVTMKAIKRKVENIDPLFDPVVAGDDLSIIGKLPMTGQEEHVNTITENIEAGFRKLGHKVTSAPSHTFGIFLQQPVFGGCFIGACERLSIYDERPVSGWMPHWQKIRGVLGEMKGRIPFRHVLCRMELSLFLLGNLFEAREGDLYDPVTRRSYFALPPIAAISNKIGPIPLPSMQRSDKKYQPPLSTNVIGGDAVWIMISRYCIEQSKWYRKAKAMNSVVEDIPLDQRHELSNYNKVYKECFNEEYFRRHGFNIAIAYDKINENDLIAEYRTRKSPHIEYFTNDLQTSAVEIAYVPKTLDRARLARHLLGEAGISIPGTLSVIKGVEDSARDLVASISSSDKEYITLKDHLYRTILKRSQLRTERLLPRNADRFMFLCDITHEKLDSKWYHEFHKWDIVAPMRDSNYKLLTMQTGLPTPADQTRAINLSNYFASAYGKSVVGDINKLVRQIQRSRNSFTLANWAADEMNLGAKQRIEWMELVQGNTRLNVPTLDLTINYRAMPATSVDFNKFAIDNVMNTNFSNKMKGLMGSSAFAYLACFITNPRPCKLRLFSMWDRAAKFLLTTR